VTGGPPRRLRGTLKIERTVEIHRPPATSAGVGLSYPKDDVGTRERKGMTMRRYVLWAGLVAIVAAVQPADAQVRWERSDEGWCDEDRGGRDSDRYCEVLTSSLRATDGLSIDGGQNGGVNVTGWSEAGIEVRAKVWANARSEARAEELARAVEISVDGGRIRAEGPDTGRRESWGVSYELRVPRSTDLDIETHNGGVSVEGVRGDIRFDALNGGVRLTGVAGDVRGRTTNGGLHIELDGEHWTGEGLDVETTNGGVRLHVPRDYSAELVTGTVNGGLDIDFPVTVQGRLRGELRTTLGEGGPMIRAVTTSGGVRVLRGGSGRREPA
jgi:hypothetical protein